MMDPDDPLVTAPELKLSMPLSPFVPASNVRITNDPLLDIVPLPEYNVNEPPVSASKAPASTPTLPPAPLLPLPNVRSNDPPRPPFDTPVPISIERTVRAHYSHTAYA